MATRKSATARTTIPTYVLTYGSFDLLHYGHIRLLKRARQYGDALIVGLSTNRFNEKKGKKCQQLYALRRDVLLSTGLVDKVIPEYGWEQKKWDIQEFDVKTLVMGDDWKGKFDDLPCRVVYLPRTKNISSTELRKWLK